MAGVEKLILKLTSASTRVGVEVGLSLAIFLNSTRKGQLKNVQDGIFRRPGSREIQETKVGTVLPDTLYKGHLANLKSLGQADLKTLRVRTYHFGLRMYQRTFCHHINF